jgi:hypothetical protein
VLIEKLARDVVSQAIGEKSFEVFLDEGEKTPLQRAITDLAQYIRYRHSADDQCDTDDT